MGYYSDPTANAAIGAVDKELRQMYRRAQRLKALRNQGRLTPEMEAAERRRFTGIYRNILKAVLDD